MTGSESLRNARRAGQSNRTSDRASEGTAARATLPKAMLAEVARGLTMRERLIVCLRYADGLTVDEIAIVLSSGTEEIERILDDAASRVRAILASATPRAA